MEQTSKRTSFAELKRKAVVRKVEEAIARHEQEERSSLVSATTNTRDGNDSPSFDEIIAGTATWPVATTPTVQIDVSNVLLPSEVSDLEIDELDLQGPRVAPMGAYRPRRADAHLRGVGVDLTPRKEKRSWLMHLATALLIITLALVAGVGFYFALTWSTFTGEVNLPEWVPQQVQNLLSPSD